MITVLILSLFSGILLLEFSTPTVTNISNSPNESNNEITNAADITIYIYIDAIYGATSNGGGTIHGTVRTESKDGTSRSYNIFTQKLSRFNNYAAITVTRTSYWWRSFEITSYSPTTASLGAYVNKENSVVVGTNGGGGSYTVTGLDGLYLRYDSGYYTRNGTFTMNFYLEIECPLDHQGGSSSTSRVSYNTYNKSASSISKPTRTGYTFKGYYTATSGGSRVIDENLIWRWDRSVCYATDLYAHWTANQYTVTLDKNTGSGGSSTVTATYDSAMPDIEIPSKGGYKFLGYWDTSASSGGTQYYNANGGSVRNWDKTSNTTLYARWERYNYRIDINFYKPDGSTQNGGTFDLYKKMPGGSETLVASEISNEIGDSLLQYEGQYILKNFKAVEDGAYITLRLGSENPTVRLSTPTGAGTIEIVNNNTIVYTANQTGQPSGSWDNAILIYTSTNNVQANLDYQGGTVVTSISPSQQYIQAGTYLSGIPTDDKMSKTGYTFKGWNTKDDGSGSYYTSSTNFNDSTQVESGHCVATPNAGNIAFDLYAIWEANKYSVTLDQQGGRDGTTTITATYASAMPTIIIPSKFGHAFNGYFDKVSDGTKYYNADGTSARNWDKDSIATLYAQWTPYTYTLTLKGNGGTTKDNQKTITESGSYDSTLTLESKPFTRSGYIFKGWSTTETGEVTYLDGANYSSLITSDNISITLYAQWKETIASNIKSTYSTAGTYYISSATDLAKLIYTTENKDVGNGYTFIQTANIDLSGLTYLPIGRLNSFSGTYDGQGYTISGIRTYDGKDAKKNYLETNGGLFANASGAEIKNVIIENATIYGQNAGIIAGSGNSNTNISNCVVSGIVNGTNTGSIIGNGNGAKISVCLAKGVNIASFAGGSASIDSCIYEINNTNKTRGKSSTFTKYNEWIYPSNFAYPMPKAFMWYPGAELTTTTLTNWINKK